jgi:Zn-dependent protease
MPFKFRIPKSFVWLFVGLLVLVSLQGRGGEGVAQFVIGFGLLFLAVLIHELAHAVVARMLGIQVRDIVLHPLGGMTRLNWSARDPRKEALISIAGPISNLFIAGLVWLFGRGLIEQGGRPAEWVVVPLLLVNLALGALNLIPAFPMDGGRMLRALLSTKMGHLRATRVAARIGRCLAALTFLAPFIAPLWGGSFWQTLPFPFVGLFVLVLGEIELKQAEAAELISRLGPLMRNAPQNGQHPPEGATVIEVKGSSRVLDD